MGADKTYDANELKLIKMIRIRPYDALDVL